MKEHCFRKVNSVGVGLTIRIADECQLCKSIDNDVIFDANVGLTGRWAYICQPCFEATGSRIGTGLGSEWHKDEGKAFL